LTINCSWKIAKWAVGPPKATQPRKRTTQKMSHSSCRRGPLCREEEQEEEQEDKEEGGYHQDNTINTTPTTTTTTTTTTVFTIIPHSMAYTSAAVRKW